MATTSTYNGTGAQTTFTVGFLYLSESYVTVTVDSVLQVQVTDYTFSGDGLSVVFEAGSIPASGTDNVVIQRVTSATPLVDFTKGGAISEADLDNATQQAIHYAEESNDNFVASTFTTSAGHWDAQSLRITSLADGIADQDAATKAQVDAVAGSATAAATAQTAAEAAQTAAETAQTAAELAETNAETAETAAELAESNITAVYPVSGLAVGRTLVADSATSFAETRTETWEFIGSSAISSDASKVVALTTATYARYRIHITDYVPGTNDQNLYLTVSDDGGSVYEAGTSYNVKGTNSAGSMARINDTGTAQFCLHDDGTGIGSAAGEFYSGTLELRPGSASTPCTIHGDGYYLDAGGAIIQVTYAGHNTTTTAEVTHIKFASESGNLGSGTLTVWGSRL